MGAAAASIAMAAAKQQRQVMARFANAGALSAERATTFQEVGVVARAPAVRQLLKQRVLRATPDGRYWCDLARYEALRRARLRVVLVMVIVLAVVALVLAMTARPR